MMEGSGGEVPKEKLDEMSEAEVRDGIAAADGEARKEAEAGVADGCC